MKTKQLEKIMEKLGNDFLSPDIHPTVGQPCWVAPVLINEKGEATVVFDNAEYGGDIYNLLDTYGRVWANDYEQIAFYTCGWAAPISNDDIAPSEHPERKRVALMCLAKKSREFGSVMRMWGNPDMTELVVENSGKGALKEMATSLWD